MVTARLLAYDGATNALLVEREGGGFRAELTATGVELYGAIIRHVFGTRRL